MADMIETVRLILRQWQPRDEASFITLNQDPEVTRYFPKPYTPEETRDQMARFRAGIVATSFGFWAAELKATQTCIGLIGLQPQPESAIPGTPFVEIGWRLAKAYWGQGLAPEGARAALSYGFDVLSESRIYAFTALANTPSRRVMEKIGMSNTGQDFDHPKIPDGHPLQRHCLYAINSRSF